MAYVLITSCSVLLTLYPTVVTSQSWNTRFGSPSSFRTSSARNAGLLSSTNTRIGTVGVRRPAAVNNGFFVRTSVGQGGSSGDPFARSPTGTTMTRGVAVGGDGGQLNPMHQTPQRQEQLPQQHQQHGTHQSSRLRSQASGQISLHARSRDTASPTAFSHSNEAQQFSSNDLNIQDGSPQLQFQQQQQIAHQPQRAQQILPPSDAGPPYSVPQQQVQYDQQQQLPRQQIAPHQQNRQTLQSSQYSDNTGRPVYNDQLPGAAGAQLYVTGADLTSNPRNTFLQHQQHQQQQQQQHSIVSPHQAPPASQINVVPPVKPEYQAGMTPGGQVQGHPLTQQQAVAVSQGPFYQEQAHQQVILLSGSPIQQNSPHNFVPNPPQQPLLRSGPPHIQQNAPQTFVSNPSQQPVFQSGPLVQPNSPHVVPSPQQQPVFESVQPNSPHNFVVSPPQQPVFQSVQANSNNFVVSPPQQPVYQNVQASFPQQQQHPQYVQQPPAQLPPHPPMFGTPPQSPLPSLRQPGGMVVPAAPGMPPYPMMDTMPMNPSGMGMSVHPGAMGMPLPPPGVGFPGSPGGMGMPMNPMFGMSMGGMPMGGFPFWMDMESPDSPDPVQPAASASPTLPAVAASPALTSQVVPTAAQAPQHAVPQPTVLQPSPAAATGPVAMPTPQANAGAGSPAAPASDTAVPQTPVVAVPSGLAGSHVQPSPAAVAPVVAGTAPAASDPARATQGHAAPAGPVPTSHTGSGSLSQPPSVAHSTSGGAASASSSTKRPQQTTESPAPSTTEEYEYEEYESEEGTTTTPATTTTNRTTTTTVITTDATRRPPSLVTAASGPVRQDLGTTVQISTNLGTGVQTHGAPSAPILVYVLPNSGNSIGHGVASPVLVSMTGVGQDMTSLLSIRNLFQGLAALQNQGSSQQLHLQQQQQQTQAMETILAPPSQISRKDVNVVLSGAQIRKLSDVTAATPAPLTQPDKPLQGAGASHVRSSPQSPRPASPDVVTGTSVTGTGTTGSYPKEWQSHFDYFFKLYYSVGGTSPPPTPATV